MDIRRSELSGSGEFQDNGGKRSGDDRTDEGDGSSLGLPWKPRSRQEDGRATEKKVLKRHGVRGHPNSGAGKIKYDGSDEDRVVEVKDAAKSFTLNRTYLDALFKNAAKQSKQAVLIVEFPDLTVEAIITRKVR